MNSQSQQLLDAVNSMLINKPLIYFCREAERAIGLENVLKNYHICCVEDSSIVDELIKKGVSIFCLEKVEENVTDKSSSNLLSNSKSLEWIQSITKGQSFFALTFLPTSNLKYKLSRIGGELLNIEYELNQRFEDKLSQTRLFSQAGITIAKTLSGEIQDFDYEKLRQEIGSDLVIQISKAHTGGGTYFINNEDDFNTLKIALAGNLVRIVQWIKGDTFTINILVNEHKSFISSPQYQITGIKALTNSLGTTVGNDFNYGFQELEPQKQKVIAEIKKVVLLLKENHYKGIAGIDFIMDSEAVYVIEVNARQTANIPFQTKLELLNDKTPLMLLHIAIFLGINIDHFDYDDFSELSGSQIFLRAKNDNTNVKAQLTSGIYRLQSDNSAIDWDKGPSVIKDNVIFIDEEKDMPLIFQGNGYSVEEIKDGGFVLNVQKQGSIKNNLEEIARMQFKNGIINDGILSPWIIMAFKKIEQLLLN